MSTTINKMKFYKYENYNIKDEYEKRGYLYYFLLKMDEIKLLILMPETNCIHLNNDENLLYFSNYYFMVTIRTI